MCPIFGVQIIKERNKAIYDLYLTVHSYSGIGELFNLSRQRIEKIVLKEREKEN